MWPHLDVFSSFRGRTMSGLFWFTITPSTSPKFLVNGTVLSSAIFGPHKRYKANEIRSYDKDRNADCYYTVQDAETISDLQVRNGVSAKVIFKTDNYDQLLTFVKTHS